MRKIFLVWIMLIPTGILNVTAQTSVIYNFEGIAFTNQGKPVANTDLLLRIWIKNTQKPKTLVYEETQSVSTNANGLFNLHIGNGKILGGSMNTVGTGDARFIKIEMASIGESTNGKIRFKCIKCRQNNEKYMLHRVEEKG